MTKFEDVFGRIVPWWLNRGVIESVLASLGEQLDEISDRALAAVRYRWGVAGDYADALPRHARERRIRQGITETDDAFAARLWAWRDRHRLRGGPREMLGQLANYFGATASFVLIYKSGRVYTLAAGGGIDDVERDDVAGWSSPMTPDAVGWWLLVTLPDDPGIEDDQYPLIPRDWNAAHCTGRCRMTVLIDGAHVWGEPFLEWGAGGLVWGGGTVKTFTGI